MAKKNLEFTERLTKAIQDSGLSRPAFAEKTGIGYSTLMNYLSRGSIGRVPEWDQLLKISEASGRTIDWFLTGKEPSTGFMNGWSQEVKTACTYVKEIIESGDKIIVPALLTSLPAMRAAVEGNRGLEAKKMYERRIRELERDVRRLQKLLEPGFGGAAGEEGGSVSKKKRTSSM